MRFLLCDLVGYEIELVDAEQLLLVGGMVVLGAVLGSFMNVVIYRMPRKMSLSRPGSRCPKCEHPIRWYDNVPVLGWLWLRGRCRDCVAPISARYPLVEALVAVVAGLLAWKAPLLVTSIPVGDAVYTRYATDVVWIVFRLLLACVLIYAAFIEFDGFVTPKRLILGPLVVGLAMLAVWPHLLVAGGGTFVGTLISGLLSGITGMLVAVVMGAGPWFAWFGNAERDRVRYATAALGELVLVGAYLGSIAVVSIGLESMALYVATQLLARKWPTARRFGWAGPLALVTLVWMVAASDVALPNLQLAADDRWRLLIATSLMVFLALVLQIVGRRPRTA